MKSSFLLGRVQIGLYAVGKIGKIPIIAIWQS